MHGRADHRLAGAAHARTLGRAHLHLGAPATLKAAAQQGLLHTIGAHVTAATTDAGIDRYVFSSGKLPSAREMADALEGRFLLEDWHTFGADYDRTLMPWWHNFKRAWPELREHCDARFHRLWKYCLLSGAGFFRSRQGQLWQLVLTRRGREQGYGSYRPGLSKYLTHRPLLSDTESLSY